MIKLVAKIPSPVVSDFDFVLPELAICIDWWFYSLRAQTALRGFVALRYQHHHILRLKVSQSPTQILGKKTHL